MLHIVRLFSCEVFVKCMVQDDMIASNSMSDIHLCHLDMLQA